MWIMLNHTIAISLESEDNSIVYYATVISRARKTFLRYFNPLDWHRLEICLASLLGSIAFTPRWMDSGDKWYHSLATPRWYLRGTVWRDPVARNWRWNMYTVKVASFISAIVASDCAARSSLCQDFNFVAILEGLWPELIARCTCAACKCWCYVAISSRIHAIRMYEEKNDACTWLKATESFVSES